MTLFVRKQTYSKARNLETSNPLGLLPLAFSPSGVNCLSCALTPFFSTKFVCSGLPTEQTTFSSHLGKVSANVGREFLLCHDLNYT